jgi:hypothetical protein
MPDNFWVLRCATTGESYSSSDEEPDDADMPVLVYGREAYWAIEPRPAPEPLLPVHGTCYTCGSDTTNGVCHYDDRHFT